MGMEGRKASDCTEYVYKLLIFDPSLTVLEVYIFKHVTVSGVYITMFVKYVSTSYELERYH